MNSVIGICDTNTVYMKKLAEAFMQKSDIPLQIMTFSDQSQLIQYLKNHNLDILIIGQEILTDFLESWQSVNSGMVENDCEVMREHIKYLLELEDQKGGIESEEDGCFRISRYQSATKLYCLIRQLLIGNPAESKSLMGDGEFKAVSGKVFNVREGFDSDRKYGMQEKSKQEKGCIIAVYSPVNRCGKTSLAVLLSEFLQRKYSSLLICMDHYSRIFSDEEFNLAELIYCMSRESHLRQEKNMIQDFSEYEDFVKRWDELSYISAPKSVEDISQISALQLCRLFDLLKHKSRFHYVIIDLSDGVESICKVLEQCDFIFMPVLEDCISQCKVEEFIHRMVNLLGENAWNQLSEKIHKVCLPLSFEASEIENYYKELVWSDLAGTVEKIVDQYNI